MKLDPKQRFTNRVETYSKYRPGYPACGLSPDTHRMLERTFGAVHVHPS